MERGVSPSEHIPYTEPEIGSKNSDNPDKDFVKLKLFRDPTSEKSDLHMFKMALFENGETEEFLLFIHNFNMTLEASGILETAVKVQYLHMLARG